MTARACVGVRTVELTESLHALTDLEPYTSVRIFALWQGQPIGSVDVANDGQPLSAERVGEAISRRLGHEVLAAIVRQRYVEVAQPAALDDEVSVSVVIATLDRPEDLRNCLGCVTTQKSGRAIEIVVVDNHPASGLTAPVVAAFPGVRYVEEPRRGLAYARNAGFLAAGGEILVATDDDVTVSADWLEKLVAPFTRSEVMAATGNVLPLELATPAQRLFEVYGGLGRGFAYREFDRRWFDGWGRAVPTWTIGATANAAVRASILRHPRIGLMEEMLGPGMPSGVGEDTYLFYKILAAGFTIVYQPAAYVWHKHRRDMRALRRQLFDYSKGHVAYHLMTLFREGDRRALHELLVSMPRYRLRQLAGRLRGRRDYPLALILLEIAGHLAGPWGLWRSRGRVRREGRSLTGPSP
jgi:GT2 family glycosyltransferase